MASLKLSLFLIVALAYVSTIRSDDEILDVVKETVDEAKKTIETQTESKGIFDSFKEKVSGYYDKAVEKGKEAFKASADAVSSQYDKLKTKAKEFIDKKPENPATPTTPESFIPQ